MGHVEEDEVEASRAPLIDHLTEQVVLKNPSSIRGVGDDAAVINNKDNQRQP